MYADDTTIYYIGMEVEDIVDKLNEILKDLFDWCQRNKLSVHTGKTEAMLITRSGFIGPLRHLKYGEATRSFTDNSTCLGIQIDNRLQWKKQVTAICKKYNAKLKFLKRLRNFPTSVLEKIYYKGIIAGVTYCIAVWGTTTVANFNQLEELHIKAARFIYKIPCTVLKHEVLGIANWKSLLYIYKRRLAAIMYQAHYN